jgi:hypothetical protein
VNLRGVRGLLGLFVLSGCCAAPDEPIGTVRSQVVYGEPSPAGGIEDAVLLLRTTVDGAELLCSASLVAPRLVLTARHCVAHLEQGPFQCTVRGELIDNPGGAGRLGLDVPADGIALFGGTTPRKEPLARGERVISTLTDTICLDDLAFVVLDRPVPIEPLPVRLEAMTRVGEAGVLVGYGMNERQSRTIDYRNQPRLRKPELAIADVGPDSIDDGVTTAAPRTLWLKGPSGCVADSGGPLLSETTNAIVGVYSLLDGDACTDANVRHEFVHVRPFQTFIEEAFAAAEAEPIAEQSASPGAEPVDESREAGITTPIVEKSAHPSSGCGLGGRRPASGVWLSGLGILTCAVRRRQRRPSSGSLATAGSGAAAAAEGRGGGLLTLGPLA